MVSRVASRPQPAPTAQVQGRTASPQARLDAIKHKALELIAGDALEFSGKAPKKTDIARQFEVKNVRPFTYTAIELKSGEVVLKKVLTGGFVPARPGDGAYTAPMKFDELSRS